MIIPSENRRGDKLEEFEYLTSRMFQLISPLALEVYKNFLSLDFPTAMSRFLEAENFEKSTKQIVQFSSSTGLALYENLLRLFNSLFRENELESIRKQVDQSCILSFLFGTEECVNLRKELGLLTERMFNQINVIFHCLYSGSIAEGVDYPPSDYDVLFYRTDKRIVKSYMDASRKGDLIMVPSEYSAVYYLLYDATSFGHSNKVSLVSSRSLKKSLNNFPFLDKTCIHGPCLMFSSYYVDLDYAPCIVCPFWPSDAKEWIKRHRYYGWPSPEMIKEIELSGCHVVPIGDPDSKYSDHEWRISFSLAERKLLHAFNHAQFLTYSILRYSLKMVIDRHFPGVLCSYFIKTTLFHTIERTSMQMWNVDNLDICFIVCLSVLYNFIDNKNCPNYFILKYNMMKRKVNDKNRQQLLDLIRHLIKARIFGVILPFCTLAYINKSWFLKFMECKLDMKFFQQYTRAVMAGSLQFGNVSPGYNHHPYPSVICWLPHLSKTMETQSTLVSIILQIRIINQCQISQNHQCSSVKQNKQRYIHHKFIQLLLHKVVHIGDVTTGKLTTATYMYMVGKTKLALLIIQKLLSRYPNYALESTSSNCKGYVNTMCSMGYTMENKARHAWAPHFLLSYFDLDVFPLPLKIWISITECLSLHPLTYALLLESLCHVQLQSITPFVKSTTNLLNHLEHLEDNYDIACAMMCLGIIRFVQEDDQSACIWFGSAYRMENMLIQPHRKTLPQSALICIACFIYKHTSLPNRNVKMNEMFQTDVTLD